MARSLVIITFFLFLSSIAISQTVDLKNLHNEEPKEAYDNIHVKKLHSDSLSSSFLIWIKDRVKPHRHNWHTEQLYVVSGQGIMTLGKETFAIKKGDYFIIQKGSIHSVKVTSDIPLKVLSIQSPEFLGNDREFID